MTRAARTGDLEASIHYGILAEQLTEWMQAEKIDLIGNGGLSIGSKDFRKLCLCRKVRLELKNLGSCFLATRDLFGDNRTGEKRAFIGLGTNMGDKQLQLETALEKSRIEAFTFFRHPQGLKQNLGEGGAGHPLNQVAEVETWMTPEGIY